MYNDKQPTTTKVNLQTKRNSYKLPATLACLLTYIRPISIKRKTGFVDHKPLFFGTPHPAQLTIPYLLPYPLFSCSGMHTYDLFADNPTNLLGCMKPSRLLSSLTLFIEYHHLSSFIVIPLLPIVSWNPHAASRCAT